MRTCVYIIVLMALAASGCKKKDYPEPKPANDSYFYARMVLNSQPVEIVTGKDGYYMYTSYTMDSSSVYNLVGEFRQTGCDNCKNTLRVQINDAKDSQPDAPIKIDSALQLKSYKFLSGLSDVGYAVAFNGVFNKQASAVLWNFGDGAVSTDLNPTHTFKAGVYKVTLKVTGADLCQSTIVNTVAVGVPVLNAYVSAIPSGNTVFFAANVNGGKAPYSCLWKFGDGSTSSGLNANHTYALNGGYGARLTVTDADGKSVTSNYNVVAGGDLSACAVNFSVASVVPVKKRDALSKVSITYTDQNGITYTSDNAAQPATSSLEIISVEEFYKNENNEPVKKLQLKFNCMLYHGAQSVSLQGTEVHLGLGYK